jgi:hypothetical protein
LSGYLRDGVDDPRVSAHAQVVIGAPHRHVSPVAKGIGVVVTHGEVRGSPVYRLKDTVRVVTLLLLNLPLKELIVAEVRDCRERKET